MPIIFQQESSGAPNFQTPWPVVIADDGQVIHGRADADYLIGFGQKDSYEIDVHTAAVIANPELAVGLSPVFQANGDMFAVSLNVSSCITYDVSNEAIARLSSAEGQLRRSLGRDETDGVSDLIATVRERIARFRSEESGKYHQPTVVMIEAVDALIEAVEKIELLHMRDPDGDCTIDLFIGGNMARSYVTEDIDPGRGWTAEDWDERVRDTAEIESYSPAFKKAVLLGLGESNDSPYITGGNDE